MNAFHSTNLFCCFSRYQAPANSVAPPSVYKPHTTHNSSICSDEGLTLENVSFRIHKRVELWLLYRVKRLRRLSGNFISLKASLFNKGLPFRATELKNDCACVTYDPVGESRRTSAGKSRLKQQIPNVKSITEW